MLSKSDSPSDRRALVHTAMSVALLLVAAASAHATLLTFDSVTPGLYPYLVVGEYCLLNSGYSPMNFEVANISGSLAVRGQEPTLHTVMLRRVDGTPFRLLGADVEGLDFKGAPWPVAVWIGGYAPSDLEFLNGKDDDGDLKIDEFEHVSAYETDLSSGYEHMNGLGSIELREAHLCGPSYYQGWFDNIEVESASSVPEPASCALLALATGGIAMVLRRRRR